MKKILFLASLAAVAMTSCTSESNEYVGGNDNTPKEIAFTPLTQPVTRTAIEGTSFPYAKSIYVAAYDVTNNRDFFAQTTFTNPTASDQSPVNTWKGSPARYWPLSACTINFLAFAEFGADPAPTWSKGTGVDANNQFIEFVMADNSSNQYDLMYAMGTKTLSAGASSPGNVSMVFNHAQALIKFTVKGNSDAVSAGVSIDKISIASMICDGTFKVTHTNYNAASGQSVDGSWTSVGTASDREVGSTTALTASEADYAQLLVVPSGNITAFTITYSYDSKQYTYTHTLASPIALAKATKYTFDITFNIHEIIIEPSITNWTEGVGGAGTVTIGG